jgi:peptide/nickel transport system ATP-binding protein
MTQQALSPISPEAATDPVLAVRDLHVTFSGAGKAADVPAVRGVSYALCRGETLGIVGESGSGKSVTSLAVLGLLPANARVSGSALLHDRELLGRGDKQLSAVRGKSIAMVFQDPLSALTPVYTVGDQVAEALRVHQRLSKNRAAKRAVELLDLVGIPNPERRAKAFPHEFSGGMRQRVVIAIAIANDPDVIVADEPTTALDVTIQAQVLEVFKTAQRETGAAVVMITHDLGVVAGLVDRVLVMYAGHPVETGTVEDIYYRPRMPYTMGLLGAVPRVDVDSAHRAPLVPIEGNPPSPAHLPVGCPFAPRCPMVIGTCRETDPPLAPVGGGEHHAACHRNAEIEHRGLAPADVFPTPQPAPAPEHGVARGQREPVLEVSGLVKHHPLMKGAILKRRAGTVYAVDGVDFDIRTGEALGLVGESGCGKTTTLLEVLELAAPQRGQVSLLGNEASRLSARQRAALRREIQIVFQDPLSSLDPRLPVSELIAEPLKTHGYPREKVPTRIRELLTLVGLEPSTAGRYPQDFSGGQRQRVGIARALALEPKLLVLDEPVSSLDVSIQAGVINLFDELRARLGLSYLFVAHDLSVIRQIADRVAVMYLGRIVEIGSGDEVFGAPAHPYTQALLSAIPVPDPRRERSRDRILLEGDLPSPADPPSGCKFRTRCPKLANELSEAQRERCIAEEPALGGMGHDHAAACHYASRTAVV